MPSIDIPTRPSDIDAAWLTAVMASHHPGVAVTSVTAGDFFGYKPNKIRLTVTYNEAGTQAGLPTALIAKGAFKNAQGEHALSDLDLGMELELQAYAEVVPHLAGVNTPRCYYVGFDAATHRGMLVLQDLTPTGATFLKEADGLDYAQTAAFIDALAQQHAQWMDSPQFAAGGRFGPGSGLRQRSDRLQREYLDQLTLPDYWNSFLVQPRGAVLPRVLRDASLISGAQRRMKQMLAACSQTLVHGDEHLGNLYLDAEGRPGFIDWCSRREPWATSFAYFLATAVDPLDRRQWERPLLRRYLDGLARHGAPAPGFDEAWLFYRGSLLFPFLVWISNSAKWQPESLNARNCMRAAFALLDHDVPGVLGAT